MKAHLEVYQRFPYVILFLNGIHVTNQRSFVNRNEWESQRSHAGRRQSWLLCCYIVAERMSERAEDDVRGEQRRAARQQLKQQQIQRGEGSTAMATVAERRSLPSPEIMLGQPWSNWVDAAKLHGHDGEFTSVPNVREKRRWSATVASSVLFWPIACSFRLNMKKRYW